MRRHLKRQLVGFARDRARVKWISGNAHAVQIVAGGVLLDPNVLTIGFARRFATYKRATLMMRDVKRLLRLINNPAMPVQILFAGKAHPADEPGKRVIQDLYRSSRIEPERPPRVPRRLRHECGALSGAGRGRVDEHAAPALEASGTSGKKAGLNGVLNFSVLDGWWRECYNGKNGWAIGRDARRHRAEAQDRGR